MPYQDKLASTAPSVVFNKVPNDANGFLAAQIINNSIDFFESPAFSGNCSVGSMLGAQRNSEYASPLRFDPPSNSLLKAGFERSLVKNPGGNFSGSDFLFIAKSDLEMEFITSQMRFFSPNLEILQFPAWDCLPFDRASPRMQILSNRIKTLHRLASRTENKNFFVIASINSLLQKTLPINKIKNFGIFLQVGSKASITEVAEFLVNKGYKRQSCANDVGEFAVRGGIIDIVVIQAADLIGYRLDFFGDVIESIKTFDPITQMSAENLKNIEILPSSEVVLTKQTIDNFCQNYRRNFGASLDDQLYQAISEGRFYDGMEHWLPFFIDCELDSLFSYLQKPAVFFGDEIFRLADEREQLIQNYYQSRIDEQKIRNDDSIYNPAQIASLYFSSAQLQEIINKHTTIEFNRFSSSDSEKRILDLRLKSVPDFALAGRTNQQDPILLMQNYIFSFLSGEEFEPIAKISAKTAGDSERSNQAEIEAGSKIFKNKNLVGEHEFTSGEKTQHKNQIHRKINLSNKKVAFAAMSEGSRERIKKLFHDFEMVCNEVENFEQLNKTKPGSIALLNLPLEMGFECEDLLLISEAAVFGEKIFRKKTSKSASRRIVEEAMSLLPGELVVHRDYGIAKFDGIQTITSSKVKTDMIKLLYGGGDALFVPVDEINLISRYGAENSLVQLDRLGAAGWKNRRDRVRKKIKIAAEELLKVAAARRIKKAPIFVPDTIFYDEFKARFGFIETDDQMRAILEVEEDLARGSPMDRLVCGDVGFGKTEVAMRASAIACKNAQIAVVVPTTILCRQHYKNFCRRFEGTGIKIAQLSRLVSSSQAKEACKEIASGEARIVIGTHALLQKSIQFHNLGLVIIDEEQHFGVAQKERLKQLRSETHILTLSATPIPRTLQMSLTGVKDLSLISTPPLDRLAVRNFLMPYDSVIVREAVMREYNRGGKVFFVVPRIRDIEEMEARLKILLPELKITHAHGQMAPSALDSIMNDFVDGKIDLLLSTTIIESGIDISSANTMIIYKAEMFGLAQLYQLRGRVGRGKSRGYCYFMLDNRKKINNESRKKLEVMQNLDSLGVGFTVASHDMDIRGSGDILGDEQSGHIKETGVELYQQLLLETIEKLKSDPEFFSKNPDQEVSLDEPSSIKIKLGISLLIPESYISDLPLRISFYKKISNLRSSEEKELIINEMSDRFGKVPAEIFNLIEVSLIKNRCQEIGVASMELSPEGLVIGFRGNKFVGAEKLMQLILANPALIRLASGQKVVFSPNFFKKNLQSEEEKIDFANQVLSKLESLL